MSKSALLWLSLLAFVAGLVWVVTYGLPFAVGVVVLGLPVVLGALSVRWGL